MFRNTTNLIAGLLTGLFIFSTSCSNGQRGFEKTDSGLMYKFHVQNEDGIQPVEGEYLLLKLVMRTDDSVFFNSMQMTDEFFLPYQVPQYEGDIYEGFNMMRANDSATFQLDAEKFFNTTWNQPLPEFIEPGSTVFADVKLIKSQTEDQIMASRMQEEEGRMVNEAIERAAYLEANNITVEPTASGLYFVEIEKGNGPPAKPGRTVKVHYTGTLLNGEKFDSSLDRGEPFEFMLGAGQVIRGWDEGIAMMNVGSKARLIIPSEIAYGSQSRGERLPANSTLVFEVELLGVE